MSDISLTASTGAFQAARNAIAEHERRQLLDRLSQTLDRADGMAGERCYRIARRELTRAFSILAQLETDHAG